MRVKILWVLFRSAKMSVAKKKLNWSIGLIVDKAAAWTFEIVRTIDVLDTGRPVGLK